MWRARPCPIWLGAGAVDKRGLTTHSSVPAAWNRDRGRAGTTLPGQALANPQEEQRRLERRKDISTAPASWVRQSRQGGKRDCKHVDTLPGPWGLAPLLPIYRRLGRAGQKNVLVYPESRVPGRAWGNKQRVHRCGRAAHVSLAGAESSVAMRWRKEGEKLRNDATIFPFRVATNIA